MKSCHLRRKLTDEDWANSVHEQFSAMLGFMNNFRRATTSLEVQESLQKEVTSGRNQISNQATSLQAYYQESAALHLQIAVMKESSAVDHAVFTHLSNRGMQDGDLTSQCLAKAFRRA